MTLLRSFFVFHLVLRLFGTVQGVAIGKGKHTTAANHPNLFYIIHFGLIEYGATHCELSLCPPGFTEENQQ